MKLKISKGHCWHGFGIQWVFAKYSLIVSVQFWNVEILMWVPTKEKVKKRRNE